MTEKKEDITMTLISLMRATLGIAIRNGQEKRRYTIQVNWPL